jgi:hypothetical protein
MFFSLAEQEFDESEEMTMIKRAFFLFGALAFAAVLIARWSNADTTKAVDDNQATIERLLKERREALGELVAIVEKEYHQGNRTLDSVILPRDSLIRAKLDTTTDKSERIALHKNCVANLKDLEKITVSLYQAQEVGLDDVLLGKAARLKAEIELHREQASND